MTDSQLYTAIGVPIIALIFAMVANFSLISRVDKRIDDFSTRIDKRFDDLGNRTDQRIDDLKDLLRAEAERNHSEVMAKFADIERRLERLESERRVIP